MPRDMSNNDYWRLEICYVSTSFRTRSREVSSCSAVVSGSGCTNRSLSRHRSPKIDRASQHTSIRSPLYELGDVGGIPLAPSTDVNRVRTSGGRFPILQSTNWASYTPRRCLIVTPRYWASYTPSVALYVILPRAWIFQKRDTDRTCEQEEKLSWTYSLHLRN